MLIQADLTKLLLKNHPVPDTAKTLGISVSNAWKMIAEKRLETIKVGSRTFVTGRSLLKNMGYEVQFEGAPRA